ncbi:ABC transporter ATP-binding protein [Rhodoferax antarcticus]|nr:ABC transporter ATP-binding protein [Rhodoferax antarcticus]
MINAASSIAIEASHIRASLGNIEILHDISMRLPRGRWTSVVGPNGAGKSTLLKVLAGLMPHTGSIQLLGHDLHSLAHRARARQLAWLGQNESSGDDLTVWDVALLGRLPHQAWLAGPSPQDLVATETALKATHAWEWRRRSLGQLSGGERQRVLLARALAVQAQVLLMDEPLANLDPPHQADWLGVVRCLLETNTTVVSVLHEISMALHADEMLIMADGRITHQGGCADPATHQALESVFDHRIRVYPIEDQWVALPRADALQPAFNHADIAGGLASCGVED